MGVGTRVALVIAILVVYAIDLVLLVKWPDIKNHFRALRSRETSAKSDV
jgi:hypothetical protein